METINAVINRIEFKNFFEMVLNSRDFFFIFQQRFGHYLIKTTAKNVLILTTNSMGRPMHFCKNKYVNKDNKNLNRVKKIGLVYIA